MARTIFLNMATGFRQVCHGLYRNNGCQKLASPIFCCRSYHARMQGGNLLAAAHLAPCIYQGGHHLAPDCLCGLFFN